MLAQQVGGFVVQLLCHQPDGVLDDGDFGMVFLQAPRSLQTQQSATENNRMAAAGAVCQQPLRIVEVSEREDAAPVDTFDAGYMRA